jgi:four helix bundle protein
MVTKAEEFRQRTKDFAIRVVKLYRALPRTEEALVTGRQVTRSGTSMAANDRSVCRAQSKAEFISKIGTVVEESDETVFWLETLVETGIAKPKKMEGLMTEANELLAIFAASQRTARNSGTRRPGNRQMD